MKMVKGLTKANVGKYGIVVREDLDFTDDGNRFRGFSYKGMPMTQCRADGECYLSIRVDYLYDKCNFTGKEWRDTEEFVLEDKFNGVREFDMDELIEILERIIAKVNEMNEACKNEEVDMTPVVDKITEELEYAEKVVADFKINFKWYEANPYTLKSLSDYLKSEEKEIARWRAKLAGIYELDRREKKELVERLTNWGYVAIKKDSFYLREMQEALNK